MNKISHVVPLITYGYCDGRWSH